MVQRLSRKLNRLFLGTTSRRRCRADGGDDHGSREQVPEQLYGQVEPVEHGICDPCENVLILKNVDEKASG